jgi:hypothetical protein
MIKKVLFQQQELDDLLKHAYIERMDASEETIYLTTALKN